MDEMQKVLEGWHLDVKAVRERMYGAPTARKRERWPAMWLLARGWSAAQVADALERDAHTIGDWLEALQQKGPTGLAFEQSGGPPRPRCGTTGDIEGGGAGSPERGGGGSGQVDLERGAAVWGRALRLLLSSRTCLNYMHRLGFVVTRPKKRLCKANAEKRATFVRHYAALRAEAQLSGAKIFFVDEAHFRADVELRSQWVLRGESALVDSTSPRFGEKANYYSAVCLESGDVLAMPVEGNTNAETSVTILKLLREKYGGTLVVIWDNGPAHRGEVMRTYLTTPDLHLRLVALPAYSPDFNPDEAIWEWVREEVTANTCFGTAAKVRAKVDAFFAGLAARATEVIQRCRRELQALADQSLLATG
jgi:transposase